MCVIGVNQTGLFSALLKMSTHLLSRGTHDKPIGAIYEDHPANHRAQNIIYLKIAIHAEAMRMTLPLISVLARPHFVAKPRSEGKLMDGNFQQRTGQPCFLVTPFDRESWP